MTSKTSTVEYQALIQVSQLINLLDLNGVLSQTLNLVMDVVDASEGSVFLLNRDGEIYQKFIAQRHLAHEDSQEAFRRVLQEGLAGWSVREKRGVLSEDVRTDERWVEFVEDAGNRARAAVCAPFLFQDEVYGVMTLVSHEVGHFTENDLELVEAIARQASAAVRNALLFDEVQTHRRRLEMVLKNTGEGLLMLDEQLRLVLVNPVAAALLEGEIDGLLGQRLDAANPDPMWRELAQRLLEVDLTAGTQIFELVDETVQREFEVKVSAVHQNERLQGYVIDLHDVTSLKDLDRLKDHMLRMASHDLKNPLAIIEGHIDLIRMDIEENLLPDPRSVSGIVDAVGRMRVLIEELLDVDKIEREARTRTGLIRPAALIQEVIEEFQVQFEQKQLTFSKELDANLLPLHGNRLQIRQAMVNLLSNAVKYTLPGDAITLRAFVEGDKFRFSVQDTGIGIPKALQAKIFQHGYRAQRDDINAIEGSGVGLSLVAEICRRHHGDVWFVSEEGVGSTFGFWLPIDGGTGREPAS